MGKKLIITEKPSVARDFARVLGVSGNKNGYIENESYVISWCYGHLVEMVYPEVYDIKYKTWHLQDLPFLPETYLYGVIDSSKEQYDTVHRLLYREDIDTVYWAGDSGKEGQTIEENIRNYGGVRKGMTELRVWIDSQTDEEIKRGIAEAKPMSDYALLGKSGIMRTIEDYSLGINFSRALSVKYGRLINDAAATDSYTAIAIGRVMTCVLGMVVNREREIRNFTETPFYRVLGKFSDIGFMGEWKADKDSAYFESPKLYKENGFKKKEDAEELIEKLNGKEAVVSFVEAAPSKKRAPLLFNLAELQSECSKLLKISPSQTLQVVQELYERKFTTYPRTDARVLTKAIAKEITKNLYGLKNYKPLSGFTGYVLENKKYIGLEKTFYVDDSKVTDHYAIIPTGYTNGIEGLSGLHKSVYELIAKRFLAIFYPAAEYMGIKITAEVSGEHFYASAKVLEKPGFLEVLGVPQTKENEEDENGAYSKEDLIRLAKTLKPGDTLEVKDYSIKEGKTSPPKRYTSGSLILAMENAGNLIEDEELREQIKGSGIGTSATRGDILEKLVRIHYLNQNPKTQIITPENLGEMIYEVVLLSVPSLLNPEMTASWEKGLEGIINGTVDDGEYRKKLEDYIRRETLKMVNSDMASEIAGKIHPFTGKGSRGMATRKPLGLVCPQCGGELTTNSFGYGCSNYFDKEKQCKFSVGQIAGCDLTEEEFKQLIETGKTAVIDRFTDKNKKHFKAALMLRKDENNQFGVVFDFSEVAPDYLEDALCPVCGGRIQITGFGYACENRSKAEGGCYFSVGDIAGYSLKPEELKELLHNGSTDVIKGFKSKTKVAFSAKLKLDTQEGKKAIVFDFEGIEPEKLEGAVCPDCQKAINIRTNGYSCSGYDATNPDSCHFFIGTIAGKKLSQAQVKELLTNGRTQTIRDFKSKNNKRFDGCLVLKKNEEGKTEIAFDFENVEAKLLKGAACPVCGKEISKSKFGYSCTGYVPGDDTSCRFRIGTIAGVKLNDSQVKELLSNEETGIISGFKSKKGTKFDAKLGLDKDETGKVTGVRFVFDQTDEVLEDAACPICGKPIIFNRFGYHCEANDRSEEGCKFYVGKIAGQMLSKEQLKKLVTEKKTDKLQGFQAKNGNTFEAVVTLDENGQTKFEF